MPKTVIGAQVITIPDPRPDADPGSTIEVQLGVHVGWSDVGTLQVAVVGWPMGNSGGDDFHVELPGFYADLSWSDANGLISAVRRARDGAYGAPA